MSGRVEGRGAVRGGPGLPALILLAATLCAGTPEPVLAQQDAPTPPPVSGRRLSVPDAILPADVLARVELLRANAERLRLYMGRSSAPAPVIEVMSAMPREVYSQALNLELRANRLAFEQIRVVRRESLQVAGEARPADVFRAVDSALAAVLLVQSDLGIESILAEEARPVDTTPSQVFNATIAAGAELNNLLQLRTSPSDVFQLVTAAVHTASALHTTIPGGPSLPAEPEFEPNKMPADVFARMHRCYALLERIGEAKGLETLELAIDEEAVDRITPSDVSDMASLVAEELSHLHRQFPGARSPARAYYPGKRFPSHVYQRAGLLERILADIAEAHAAGAGASAGGS